MFWGLCMWKGISKLRNKDMTWISLALFCLGIYLMISTGFTWWKLLGVVMLSCVTDISAGIIGSGMLLMKIISGVMKISSVGTLQGYGWISVLLISLSFFLLFYHYVLGERDETITKMYLGKNLYWFVVAAIYALFAFSETAIRTTRDTAFDLYGRLFGHEMVDNLLDMKPLYIGVAGAVFCLIWIGREMMLIFIEKQIDKRR